MQDLDPLRLRPVQKCLFGLLLLAAAGVFVACGGGPQYPRPSTFGGYPPDKDLDRIISVHQESPGEKVAGGNVDRIVLTTWFQDGTPSGASQFCSVTKDGRCSKWIWMPEPASKKVGANDLSPATVKEILAALASLPPSQKPPIENMVIVSFWSGEQWETRLYDRTNKPAGLSTVFELTGAPIVP